MGSDKWGQVQFAGQIEPDPIYPRSACFGTGVAGADHSLQPLEYRDRQREDDGGTLLAGDLGCLMNMAGKLRRRGSPVKARHVAEVLAGMADRPAIGEGER